MASKQNDFSPNGAPESFENFDLVKRVKLEFTDVQVSKWKSRETGLSVVHLDYEGAHDNMAILPGVLTTSILAPIVNGYFVIATESALLSFRG